MWMWISLGKWDLFRRFRPVLQEVELWKLKVSRGASAQPWSLRLISGGSETCTEAQAQLDLVPVLGVVGGAGSTSWSAPSSSLSPLISLCFHPSFLPLQLWWLLV